jgi:hypothetical protein
VSHAIALRTTHVTPLRRAAAQAALRKSWRPGDAVAVRFFNAPTAEELDGDAYLEFDWAPAREGDRAFVRGFTLWVDAALDASQIQTAVLRALRAAR